MELKLMQWGNSLAMRVPKTVADTFKAGNGDTMNVEFIAKVSHARDGWAEALVDYDPKQDDIPNTDGVLQDGLDEWEWED